jgi:hypothetical protein
MLQLKRVPEGSPECAHVYAPGIPIFQFKSMLVWPHLFALGLHEKVMFRSSQRIYPKRKNWEPAQEAAQAADCRGSLHESETGTETEHWNGFQAW